MPDPIIEPPPAATPPPAAPSGAEPPTDDVVPESVRSLLANLDLDPDKPKEPEKKAEPAPDAAKGKAKPDGTPEPPKPDAGATPPEPELRVRGKKLERPALPLVEPTKPAGPTKPEPFKPDPQWESSLESNEKEMLTDARYMEERFPDKYKGMAERTVAFLKANAEKMADPNFDDQSQEYRQWLDSNQPRLTREEIREIEATRIADKVRGDYEGKLADVRHKLFVRDTEPKIQQEGAALFSDLAWKALPDEVAAEVKKDGIEKASAKFGLEIQTAQAVLNTVVDDICEFKRITTSDPETNRPLQPVVTDPRDPKFAQHQRLSDTVGLIEESFKKNAPATAQVRNGRWFVTSDEWHSIRADQRNKFWRLSPNELLEALKLSAKPRVAREIEEKRKYITGLGFTRAAPKAEPPPAPNAPPPSPIATPRVTGGPVPGDGGIPDEVDARIKALAGRLNS